VLEHQSLPDTLRQTLRRRILGNELPAGSRLVEADLAADYGVSRATVRQALRDLQSEGLVEISPRRHTMVIRMSPEDITDICHARYVLESAAAREAIEKLPGDFFTRLDRVIDDMARAAERGDVDEVVTGDTRFHQMIVKAAGRRRVAELWATMNAQMYTLMRFSLDRQGLNLPEVSHRHRTLAKALATRDAATVESAIRAHYLDPTPKEDQ
jgi:DNA-binding GntR family transcriptional regulator